MRHAGRATLGFATASLLVIGVATAGVAFFYRSPEERRAIAWSASVAFGVQLAAYALVRCRAREDVMVGWGLGALLRFGALLLYGGILVKVLALPSAAALVSLATFLFLSTLVEPLWLNA